MIVNACVCVWRERERERERERDRPKIGMRNSLAANEIDVRC